jgi:dihydroorotate dehydrogenase (NAD+) catalytic subunit
VAGVTVRQFGRTLASPVVLASGPAGFGVELVHELDLASVGALTTKTITPKPRTGNPQPRLVDCPCGALNSIGLENPGIEAFLSDLLPQIVRLPTALIVSVTASTADEVEAMVRLLAGSRGIDAIELNLSCPNVQGGVVGADEHAVRSFTRAACSADRWPILVKLSGDAGRVVACAKAAFDEGAIGLTLINTLRGMRIDRDTGRPFLRRDTGGLSGPAILPVALARVFEARQAFPKGLIIGTGGVCDIGSLIEMLLAGADLVGIGFGLMADPELPQRLHDELLGWLDERGIESVDRITGLAHQGGFDVQ